MATSPLDPSHLSNRADRSVSRGHGTRALGPSDSSDSGSDLVGAPGSAEEEGAVEGTAGPDVGDADLDSDSDRAGTGERAAAGRDPAAREGADIEPDRVDKIDVENDSLGG